MTPGENKGRPLEEVERGRVGAGTGQRADLLLKEEVYPGVEMEFVYIPPGRFTMGSKDGDRDERTVHEVEINRGFYLARYPVTRAHWERVMDNDPSRSEGPNRPVDSVSWQDAAEYLEKLNAAEGGPQYRMPTEAEWEYACRAGTTTVFSFGDDDQGLALYAWYRDNSGFQTQEVGLKQPNAWGLYDMHGNVWEWCLDWYDEQYYAVSPRCDPQGPPEGTSRVLRGGSWDNGPDGLHAAGRNRFRPAFRSSSFGFRCARTF